MCRKALFVLVSMLLLTACGGLPSIPKLGPLAQSTLPASASAPATPGSTSNSNSTNSTPGPIVTDPKMLVDNLLKASNPDSRYAALLAVKGKYLSLGT